MNDIIPVILCGGSGTRLWPLSRAGFPKQFLVLSGSNSLFQQAVERLQGVATGDMALGETLVVTNEEHRFLALDQLRELKDVAATLLLEPVARNTAPALTLAALHATAQGEDPILVVTPADQTITDSAAFTAALQASVQAAADGSIVILGITPDKPETGYGYIKVQAIATQGEALTPALSRGEREQEEEKPSLHSLSQGERGQEGGRPHPNPLPEGEGVKSGSLSPQERGQEEAPSLHSLSPQERGQEEVPSLHSLSLRERAGVRANAPTTYPVEAFAEKPDADTAQRYLAEGGYYWNAGMFVLRASSWLKALAQFRPDIASATVAAWAGKTEDAPFIRPSKAAFAAVPSESIDYAVMEHCPGSAIPIRMVPLDAGWSDLGAWDAVWQVGQPDAQGNVTRGDVLLADTRDSLVYASSRLVGAVGVSNLVIVETADAVLVADRSQSQNVKKLVAALEQQKRDEHTLHRKVHRPWGWYDSIDEAERFKVKRIQVKPGASLSLQKHHHRAEHWIVVKGTAEVTCGDKKILLGENQSTYIPLGEVHRLANPGKVPLEIIEVQSGSYLGEDDIVRFEDTYGRS